MTHWFWLCLSPISVSEMGDLSYRGSWCLMIRSENREDPLPEASSGELFHIRMDTLQQINTHSIHSFINRSLALAEQYSDRFAPAVNLVEPAEKG